MKNKKNPTRRCVGCQNTFSKKEMIRVVKSSKGEFNVDFSGKMNGRGAYICNDIECLQKAIKNKGLEKSFKMVIPEYVKENIKKEFNKNE